MLGTTVKSTPLLATPPTVTTTLPVVVAPEGTGTTMLVPLQLLGVAVMPLNVTALVPCEAPKFDPVIVTDVPTRPEFGLSALMLGPGLATLNATPLLATPLTLTTTLPDVAPFGTATTMLVWLQLVGVAETPLKVTVLVPCDGPKLLPAIVTAVPTGPLLGVRLATFGGGVTVKVTPLLANPPTVTTTAPLVAPVGTVTVMLVALQFVGVAATPLRVTVLLPCDAPKFEPVIVRELPTGPLLGERLAIDGVIVKLKVPLT
jgi:hypothetical protein